jgi:hypothetical protein
VTTENGAATITLADRIHFEEIAAQARTAKPGRQLASLILLPFFVLGWLVGKGSRLAALMTAYLGVAIRTGWRTARSEPLNQPDLSAVLADNAQLRAQLERLGG